MDCQQTYQQLRDYLVETSILASTGNLLGWDELTYMPPKAADGRSSQMALISRMTHDRFVAPQVGQQLNELSSAPLDADASVNVREWKRLYDREVRVPSALVEEMTRTGVHSRQAWGEARSRSEFALFKPWLQKTIDLRRQYAACILGHTPSSSDELYDALLDEYEPYQTTAQIRSLFAELRPPLVNLIQRVKGSNRSAPTDILKREYPATLQKQLAESAARQLGFDFDAGRLDTTLHPFCSGIAPGDTRITTRYDDHDLGNCFFSVIHETGHALYDQGLPAAHWGTPLGDAISLGIHESQSRLWENLVCRSEPFWRYFHPIAQQAFPVSLGGVGLDELLFAINAVTPSLIRTEADEMTYNLHVIIRFELEQALLSGQLPVDQLPEAWNQKMHQSLGIEVPDDRRGCLQDVHWSQGGFGYFPTYTLGNLNAAALFEAIRAQTPNLDQQLAAGDFSTLLAWLRDKIHRHGKRYRASELMQQATGHPLTIAPLIRHLEAKAKRYYGV